MVRNGISHCASLWLGRNAIWQHKKQWNAWNWALACLLGEAPLGENTHTCTYTLIQSFVEQNMPKQCTIILDYKHTSF